MKDSDSENAQIKSSSDSDVYYDDNLDEYGVYNHNDYDYEGIGCWYDDYSTRPKRSSEYAKSLSLCQAMK